MLHGQIHTSADEMRILEAIFWHGNQSRHQLTEVTQFSKTKVVGLVADLIHFGTLLENGSLESSGGRRAVGVGFNPALGYLIGINLGAVHLEVVLSDVNLNLLGRQQQPIDVRKGPGVVMREIQKMISKLLREHQLRPSDVLAIGMGVPGPVDHETGFLISPPIMPGWQGFSVHEYFRGEFDAYVFIDNDVNIMALGELWHHRKHNPNSRNENFIVVKLGTGIGAGIIAQGEVFRGADGAAGDVGHICIETNGQRCHCGNLGCLEAYAGAPAIIRTIADVAQQGLIPSLTEDKIAELTLADVVQLCREGDNQTLEIIQNTGSHIGQMIATLVNFFNPSRILLGGSVAHMNPLMLSSIRQSVYARSLALSTRKLRIDYTVLQQQAGTYGSITLAMLGALHKGIHL